MNTSVPYERESRWNVIECFTPHHTTSNCIKTRIANPKFTTQTLKTNHDVHKTSARQSNTVKHQDMSGETYFTQGDQTKPKIFLSRNQFVKCKQFNPIFIIALKAGISSSLHTIILRKQTQTKHPIGLILFCVYFSFH